MLSTFSVLLIGAFLCLIMLFVLSSLVHTDVPGIKEWCVANCLAIVAFVLYALGAMLPPVIAYEVANGVYATASAVVLLGFRRFFAQRISLAALGLGVVAVVISIAVFHYLIDSFAMRTVTVALFQSVIALLIGLTIYQSRKAWRSRYPYLFTGIMAVIVTVGHGVRGIIYAAGDNVPDSLLQPSAWNLFFLSAGTLVLPVLTMGAVMMVHDTMMTRSEHAANRDFLTGAWSRRAFFELAERELSRARRTGRKLSLLLLDVDHFKSINDNFGHAGGDQVLMDIVLRADMAIRDIDYFGRVGGEEFAVLLPETDRTAALLVAERLRATLERSGTVDRTKDAPGIATYTVSIGLAVLRDSESFQDLMMRADAALYKAKASGRNTVVAFPR
ncbi:MAG: GGDEF domain-containing protein [Pseudomonadota bacterium]